MQREKNSGEKIGGFFVLFFHLAFKIDSAVFLMQHLPQRCISLFEQGAVVCVSVKLQTTSGHIW